MSRQAKQASCAFENLVWQVPAGSVESPRLTSPGSSWSPSTFSSASFFVHCGLILVDLGIIALWCPLSTPLPSQHSCAIHRYHSSRSRCWESVTTIMSAAASVRHNSLNERLRFHATNGNSDDTATIMMRAAMHFSLHSTASTSLLVASIEGCDY